MALTTTYQIVPLSEFTANGLTPGNQLAPDVLALSNGGFVVAYTSDNPEGGNSTVLDFYEGSAQHQHVETVELPHDGSEGTNSDGQPSLVELDNGNVLVMWEDHVAGDSGLKGQLFTTDGVPIGDEIDVFGSGNDGDDLQITALEDGGFVLTFADGGDVFRARYNDTGVLQGTVEQVNDSSAGTQTNSAAAALSGGGYVVTYTDFSTADPTIRARVYDEDGDTIAADFALDTTGDNTLSKVVGLPDGNWAVVYTDTGWGGADAGNSGITLQIYSPTGENVTDAVGGFVRVNVPSAAAESQPDVTVLDNGYILVSWTSPTGAGVNDIRGRLFTPEGVPVTDEFPITTGGGDSDSLSNIAGLASGEFVTVWQDAINGDPVGGEGSDQTGSAITAVVSNVYRDTVGDGADDSFTGDELRDSMDGNGGVDTLDGAGGNDTIFGGVGDDALSGGDGTDLLYGEEDDDTLTGGDGTDLLHGGSGNDTMTGGAGDDVYYVDSLSDVVVEAAGGGNDRLQVSLSYTLASGAQIEELTTDGMSTDPINLTGNEADNTIRGNSGENVLNGAGGADEMSGHYGDDTYIVDNAGDEAIESSSFGGTDTVQSSVSFILGSTLENLNLTGGANINGTGNVGANAMTGNSGSNTLTGYGGADRLDGSGGADSMIGGNGDDTYVVDNAGDTASEASGSGTDLVQSTVAFTLGSGIENLVLNGASAINGTGNASANAITGNSAANTLSGLGQNDILTGYGGADTLNGGTGADAMSGGNGDDTYVVDNAGDTASEASGSGIDTVQSTVSFTLAAGIEKLVLTGAAAINGTGNGSANTMSGTSAVNRLDGNGGADTLSGFGGADVFVFDDGDGADTITDFANGSDKFDLTAVDAVDDFSDVSVIDNGATVTVNYGTGSFELANVGNPAQIDASDFIFA